VGSGADLGGGQWRVGWGEWSRPLQFVQNYQMETHVHGSGYDERYKCIEMQYQNIDNQGAMRCNKKPHMERNENPIYDCYMDAKNESKDTQKYAKNDGARSDLYKVGRNSALVVTQFFTYLFDKIFEKSKNNKKQQKSKKHIF
jgi:hypothetical protein